MRIDHLRIDSFRNLKNFQIDFDETRFSTVLIGENGAGKSNLLEAIVLIFRDIDLGRFPDFSYEIVYQCRGERIRINATKGLRQIVFVGAVGEEKTLTWRRFLARKEDLLPRHVFAYYSGPSNRLRSYFELHQKRFYDALLKDDTGTAPPIRRFFYCLPEHSRWVLLAYFLRGDEPPEFIRDHFGIDAFDSALLVLKRPSWRKGKRPPRGRTVQLGDARFWWARGVVKTFLQRLWEEALAPMYLTEDHQEDYRSRPIEEERLYLYLKDLTSLQNLNGAYPDEASFFAALESMDISDLIRDVRVRVRRGNDSIVFSELSEGEQQLLTVIGLMQFTRHEESLFLLDEPDTHLNPIWKLSYLRELARQVGLPDIERDESDALADRTSQLLMTTHDPLTIAGLRSSQVQIFSRRGNSTDARQPTEDPQGLGVAGVLTHMFGLPTTLDPQTQEKIDERNRLSRILLRSPEQEERFNTLAKELSDLGLAYEARDPDYRLYLEARHRWERARSEALDTLPIEEQDRIVDEILSEILGRTS